MKTAPFVLFSVVCCLSFGCTSDQKDAGTSITLNKELLPTAEGHFVGLSNIFFSPPGDEGLRLGPGWEDVEVADIARGTDFRTVYAVRIADTSATGRVYVDTDADLDFTDEEALHFRDVGALTVADVRVHIRPVTDSVRTSAQMLDYQIIASQEDGYTYARVVEHRCGRIAMGDDSYEVALRPSGRNAPWWELDRGPLLYVDYDNDGAFRERWMLADDGTVLPAEIVDVAQPFLLGGRPFEAIAVNQDATQLTIQPSDKQTAPVVGFATPNLSAYDVTGLRRQLSEYEGQVVLLEFWSLSCPFCEHIRTRLNDLAERYGEELVVLTIAKEADAEAVGLYLEEHPKAATMLLYDESAWSTFNPQVATPSLYLIDRDGIIRMKGQGASAVDPLETVVEQYIASEVSE